MPLSKAPDSSRQAIQKFGEPALDDWIANNPIKNSLPATAQVTAFDLWDKKIGSTK